MKLSYSNVIFLLFENKKLFVSDVLSSRYVMHNGLCPALWRMPSIMTYVQHYGVCPALWRMSSIMAYVQHKSCVKVRGYSKAGTGPWSSRFAGRTLIQAPTQPRLVMVSQQGLWSADMSGRNLTLAASSLLLKVRQVI